MDWREIPSLAALRAFEAAVRKRSYSAAARELNVTHAAIAQHVRALEEHFSTSLMERQGRGMAPTAEGQRLATALTVGFEEIATGVRALMQEREGRPISLTTTPTFAENWLMPRIVEFWTERPDIPLTIVAENRVHDLRREGRDIAIRYGRGAWPGLEVELLTRAQTVVVGAPALASRLPKDHDPADCSSAKDLADLPWVVDASYGEYFTWIRSQGLNLDEMKPTELEDNALVLAACRAGAGVSMQPYPLVEQDINLGALKVVLEQTDPNSPGYYILRLPGPMSPATRAFIDWLKSAI